MVNFRRFDSDDLKIMDSQDFPNRFGVAQHIRELYEIIAEAELLAYRMTKGGNMSWGPECSREMAEHARTFLERMSK